MKNKLTSYIKKIKNRNYKYGWIEEIDDDLIICRLRKDYELDDCLTINYNLLTLKQKELVAEGQIIKYHKKKNKILFVLSDGNWC